MAFSIIKTVPLDLSNLILFDFSMKLFRDGDESSAENFINSIQFRALAWACGTVRPKETPVNITSKSVRNIKFFMDTSVSKISQILFLFYSFFKYTVEVGKGVSIPSSLNLTRSRFKNSCFIRN